MTTELKLSGGCLCGDIRYVVTGEPLVMGYCHCRSCQQASGCGYYAWISILCDQVKFEGTVKEYESYGGTGKVVYRGFCGRCGSRLSSRGEWLGSRMTIAAGSLDDPSKFKPQMHFWTEEAQVWDCMDAQIPMYERGI